MCGSEPLRFPAPTPNRLYPTSSTVLRPFDVGVNWSFPQSIHCSKRVGVLMTFIISCTQDTGRQTNTYTFVNAKVNNVIMPSNW